MTSVLLLSLGNIKSSSRGLLDRQETDNSILSLLEKTNSNKGRDFSWIFSVYSDYALSMLFLPPISQKLMEDNLQGFPGDYQTAVPIRDNCRLENSFVCMHRAVIAAGRKRS